MPRTVKDAKLETRTARDRLKLGERPHWKTIIPGTLHLGYRRKTKDKAGVWLARRYVGGERYQIAPLGPADDNGSGLPFDVAQRRAQAWFADKKEEAAREASGAPPKHITVEDAIAEYIDWLRIHRATADDAERRARKLILPELGAIRINQLTTKRLAKWLHDVADRPALLRTANGAKQNYKPAPKTKDDQRARRATANRTLTILKAALNKAWENGAVADRTPWERVKPFEQVNAARPSYLEIAEAARLINAADAASGFRNIVRAALLTGCRYGELCALKVRDYKRSRLHIAKSKSGGARNVVLTEEGAAFFESITVGRAPSEVMFLRYGEEPWAKSQQARLMRAACAAARITPAVGIHQLRHTYASHSVMNGMPLPVLAHNLGHASIAMIQRHYGHLSESFIDDAVRQHAPVFGVAVETNVKALRG